MTVIGTDFGMLVPRFEHTQWPALESTPSRTLIARSPITARCHAAGLPWPDAGLRPQGPLCANRRSARCRLPPLRSPCAEGHAIDRPRIACVMHAFFQTAIDDIQIPFLVFDVLNPFEITDGHTAGIGKNIRRDRDAARRQMSSTAGVVGALAASTISLAWTAIALSA